MPPTNTSTLGDAGMPTSAKQYVADRAHSDQRSRIGSAAPAVPRSRKGAPSQSLVLSYPQWQARHLAGRDLLFGVALLLMYLIYLHKTLPAVCAAINQWHDTTSHQQQSTSTAWYKYVCNSHVTGSNADTCTAADESSYGLAATSSWLMLAAGIVRRVITAVMKALTGFFGAAFISNDPLYLITPLVRLAALLLLLLPLPYPNLAAAWHALRSPRRSNPSSSSSSRSWSWISWYYPDYYWQYPCIRNTVVIGQRLLPGAVVAVCRRSALCSTGWPTAFLAQPCMWRAVGKYAYAGWTACMLMLPLRLHLLVNVCEWIIHNMVYAGPDTHSSSSSSSSSGSGVSDLQHAFLSIWTVVILPTAVVWWLEKGQRRRYLQVSQQAQHEIAAAAAAAAAAAVAAGASRQAGSSSGGVGAAQSSPGSLKQQQQQEEEEEAASSSMVASRSTSGSSSQMHSIFSTQSGQEVYLTEQDLCGTGSSSGTPRRPRRSTSSPDPRELQLEDGAVINTSISASSSSNCSCSGVPIRSISSPLATDFAAAAAAESREPVCQQQLLADVTASLQLAAERSAAAAAAVSVEPQMPSEDLVRAASLAAGLGGQISRRSSSSVVQPDLSGLRPAIRSLLADEAAEVFAAAAANAAAAGAAPGLYTSPYRGVARSLPIIMKVHSPHEAVSRLAPVLTSVLHHQLMSGYNTHSAPLAIHTAAFEGCVQLIANVIGLEEQLPVDPKCVSLDGDTAVDAAAGSSRSSSLAATSLLSAVSHVLQRNTQQDPAANTAAGAGASDQDAVDVWAASSKRRNSSLNDDNELPRVDVTVGTSVVSSHSSCSSSAIEGGKASSDPDPSVVALQSCSPVVLTSGLDLQEIRLGLNLSGQQQQQQQIRALVIRDGEVIIDDKVTLAATVSVTVPPQQPGLIHVVLLNGDPAPNGDGVTVSQSAHTPLLLLPLLVLPAAAAAEMQQHFQQQAAASGGYEPDNIHGVEQSAAWFYSIMPLTVDVAYILGLCAAAKAAAPAIKVPLPSSAQLVLRHLLVHMAACGMWHVMHWVVNSAAAVFCSDEAAAAAADLGSGDISSTSSVGTSSVDRPNDSGTAADARSSNVAASKVSASLIPKRSSNDSAAPSAAKTLDSRAATSGCQTLAAQTANHRSTDLRSQHNNLGNISAHSKPSQSPAPALNPDRIAVAPAELLWGFTERDLEAQYQAAAFSNSVRIDLFNCLFYLVFSLGAYRAKGAAAMLGQQGSGGLLRFNEVLCVVVNVWGPVAVLMLRWRVGRLNLQLSSGSQQQQQRQQQQSPNTKSQASGFCSSGVPSSKQQLQQRQQQQGLDTKSQSSVFCSSGGATTKQQQQQQVDQISDHSASSAPHQQLVQSAETKQMLMATYAGTILLWGAALLLCGSSGRSVLITPVVLVKAWSKRGWSQDLMTFLSLTIRGCTAQVPFAWWLPLAIVSVLMNAIGSIQYGLMPRYWLLVRYIPLLAVTLGMNALQHIEGRKRFCIKHRIPLKP